MPSTKGSVTVTGPIANKKYTPEQLCQLMGVCNGGLRTIREYFRRWGKKTMSLMEILETVDPNVDIGYTSANTSMERSGLHPLREQYLLRKRLSEALENAVYFKHEPRLWKRGDDNKFFIEEGASDLGEYMEDKLNLGSSMAGNPYRFTDCEIDSNDILYQLLHDAANGLLAVEIRRLTIEDYDNEVYEVVVR